MTTSLSRLKLDKYRIQYQSDSIGTVAKGMEMAHVTNQGSVLTGDEPSQFTSVYGSILKNCKALMGELTSTHVTQRLTGTTASSDISIVSIISKAPGLHSLICRLLRSCPKFRWMFYC